MPWRVDETGLILDGNRLVGSMVFDSANLIWKVEILRFDGDRSFTGTYRECLRFIDDEQAATDAASETEAPEASGQ